LPDIEAANGAASQRKATIMSNCFDFRCPRCGDEDSIDILAEVWLRVTADGTDADASANGHHEWISKSTAQCAACGHTARLAHFETEDEVQS
jgi:Zn ribbon nucleic-acid-binding protein